MHESCMVNDSWMKKKKSSDQAPLNHKEGFFVSQKIFKINHSWKKRVLECDFMLKLWISFALFIQQSFMLLRPKRNCSGFNLLFGFKNPCFHNHKAVFFIKSG
ncbi:hypothetical protein L1987_62803 [Smallanthus sonchifolius]|uniref:Uncharacterized protein n=1 Tax=Smallanthus sonchifolius TaxID=185202 RepID=A0ACB9CBF0_9ASTR|nr:hypothetical protein L1987_62803 [Smallanthus sonchifolius]